MTTPTDYGEPGYWVSATVVGHGSIIYGDIAGSVLANRWTYTLTSPAFIRRVQLRHERKGSAPRDRHGGYWRDFLHGSVRDGAMRRGDPSVDQHQLDESA